jgi:hypothetical protein
MAGRWPYWFPRSDGNEIALTDTGAERRLKLVAWSCRERAPIYS